MHRSSIRARLAGAGAATVLVAALFAQAAPILAVSHAPASQAQSSASQANLTHALTPTASGVTSRPVSRGSVNVRALPQEQALPFSASAVTAALAKAASGDPTHAAPASKPAIAGPPAPVLATSSGQAAASTPVAVPGLTEAGSGVEPAD
ncbi:MAG TPA: hypothetical protein VII45_10890, partial [Solirubrobacterales bacterium]